jgi:hypothetical protein
MGVNVANKINSADEAMQKARTLIEQVAAACEPTCYVLPSAILTGYSHCPEETKQTDCPEDPGAPPADHGRPKQRGGV